MIRQLTLLLICTLLTSFAYAQIPGSEAEGRWDIIIQNGKEELPSWLEIKTSGSNTLVGRFVGPVGSARPISEIHYDEDSQTYSFKIPPQWGNSDLQAKFSLQGNKLSGSIQGIGEGALQWSAEQTPPLKREKNPSWGEPTHLLDEELSHWVIPENNQFRMKDGVLVNQKSGGNIMTKKEFEDFTLHIEFRYPKGSNSGVYLRGRHEVQIVDSYGQKPDSQTLGAVYGFIAPSENVAKKPGEWQTYEITFIGRMVTVELNGTEVICDRPIPGITGGALDSQEGEPGPIMIQGDHGPVEFRNITIKEAVKN